MLLASCCRTENEQWSNRGVRESFTPVQLGRRACELQRQWAPTLTLLPPDAESPPATLHQRVMGPGDPFRLVDPCGSHSFSLSSKPVFRCVVPCHRAVVFQAPACRLTHLVFSEPHVFPETVHVSHQAGLETRKPWSSFWILPCSSKF